MEDEADEKSRLEKYAANPGREWRFQVRVDGRVETCARDGTFDELVVDHWMHVESMDERTWWMRIGDARIMAYVAADGTVSVDVVRGFYDEVCGATETHEAE